MVRFVLALAVMAVAESLAFGGMPGTLALRRAATRCTPPTTMLFNVDRSRRTAGAGDRLVTLSKPLGLELKDGPGGSVVIADIIDGSNAADAARRGLLKVGDIVVMCSATFGDALWSTRGVGRDRVTRAISVRAGAVSLVLESPDKFKASSKAAQAADEKNRQSKEKEVRSLQDQIKAEETEKKGGFGGFKLW